MASTDRIANGGRTRRGRPGRGGAAAAPGRGGVRRGRARRGRPAKASPAGHPAIVPRRAAGTRPLHRRPAPGRADPGPPGHRRPGRTRKVLDPVEPATSSVACCRTVCEDEPHGIRREHAARRLRADRRHPRRHRRPGPGPRLPVRPGRAAGADRFPFRRARRRVRRRVAALPGCRPCACRRRQRRRGPPRPTWSSSPCRGTGTPPPSPRCAEPLAGKIVVDCVNPLGFDKQGPYALHVEEGSAAQQAAALLPESPRRAPRSTTSARRCWPTRRSTGSTSTCWSCGEDRDATTWCRPSPPGSPACAASTPAGCATPTRSRRSPPT